MKTIKGISRHQMQFASLDDMVAADSPIRILCFCKNKPAAPVLNT